MESDACVMCRRTADEIGHGAILLWRKRPMHASEYEICLDCARAVKLSQSEPTAHAGAMLAGISQPYSPDRENGVAGKLAGRGKGNP